MKELTTNQRKHIEHIGSIPGVSKILPPRIDMLKCSTQEGVYFDPKGASDYCRSLNQLPLIIIDYTGKGRCMITVCALPGHYDSVREQIEQYQLDGCGKGFVTRDSEIKDHLETIRSLEEVQKIDRGRIVKTDPDYSSGIYDVLRTNGHVNCTAIGTVSGLGLGITAIAVRGKSPDLEWMLQNYQELYRS
jgi:hypothetical protein